MDERRPAFEAVINRFGGGRSIRHLQSVPGQPVMEFIENRFGLLLPYSSPFVRAQLGDVPLDLVELLNGGQCLLGNLALVVGVQVEEFAARWPQPPDSTVWYA